MGSYYLTSIIYMLFRPGMELTYKCAIKFIPWERICCKSRFDPEEWPLTSEDTVSVFLDVCFAVGVSLQRLAWVSDLLFPLGEIPTLSLKGWARETSGFYILHCLQQLREGQKRADQSGWEHIGIGWLHAGTDGMNRISWVHGMDEVDTGPIWGRWW